MSSYNMEELYSWQTVGGMAALPEPNRRYVRRYSKLRKCPVFTLLGAFDIYQHCLKEVMCMRAETKMKKRGWLPRLPMVGCGGRKAKMIEYILAARDDKNRVMELKLMCSYFQAEEIVDLYEGLFNDICGVLPEHDEKFREFMKRCQGKKLIEISGSGWRKVVRRTELKY